MPAAWRAVPHDTSKDAWKNLVLKLEEKDLVTGQYLKEAEKAIEEVVRSMDPPPKALFLCITCIDLLLGSDYTSLAKKMEKKLGIRIGITHMKPIVNAKLDKGDEMIYYALHSVLRGDKDAPKRNTVNVLGRELPPDPNGEFVTLLKKAGVEEVYHISQFDRIEEADKMCLSRLNIAINYSSLPAAGMMKERWNIPYVYLENSFLPEEIDKNYRCLEEALDITIEDGSRKQEVSEKLREVAALCQKDRIVVGEMLDKRPLRSAKEFLQLGIPVEAVFNKIVLEEDYPHLEEIVKINPELEIYMSRDPSMMKYIDAPEDYDLGIGMNPFLQRKSRVTKSVQGKERYPQYTELERILDEIKALKSGAQEQESMMDKVLGAGNGSGTGNAAYKQMKRWGVGSHEKLK